MSQLQKLREATTLAELAELLNFKAQGITYLLFKLTDSQRYFEFEISKRSGGTRTISAPTEKLKRLQSNLTNLLSNCLKELDDTGIRKTPFVHGFVKGRSIITNAKVHRNKRWVLNLDLQDFFGVINFGRVRGTLIKDRCFQLHPDVATLIAQIACRNNGLPQGSPCSPIIANMVARSMDLKLIDVANQYGLRYSRYADDITFSTRKHEFPEAVARNSVPGGSHDWVLGEKLKKVLIRSGFAENPNKTRLQYLESRQEVTGLVVNKRVNVTREYRKQVRAMVHSLVSTGEFKLDNAAQARVENKCTKSVDPLKQLQGMLGFIDWVDIRARGGVPKAGVISHDHKYKTAFKECDLTSQEKQYRKYLFYREFFLMERPVILTEGKTDKVHLYAAIKKQAFLFPLLADATAVPANPIVRVFPCVERRTNALMGLTAGAPNLASFIAAYEGETKKFHIPATRQPVIIVVDLDSGWKKIQFIISNKGHLKPDGSANFYRVGSNLYVVCIPPPTGASEGCIEDLYSPTVLSMKIGVKSFDKSNNTKDVGLHYGKHVFAEQIVRAHANKINFSGFNPLLERISLAIANYSASHVSP
ncbi:retron Ec67 family RNA-directed DNA polymerase/endonuclease [Rhodoferax sp.]|uniref:retron Ec67 family RNA-directed DNA polymerase/endonuclease n=1 Tax=Rhodoferax sp. TaxID=50421 RepID=UPI00284D9659|nr:retron Ec67 family RNA-directed DNA polymerase/endonuclease [Rhodoferax sp.]MDR3367987.1 retron Ec67 family RNA-directed DNA polymerase/endonuclease [Rhodoferax sp.]